MHCSSVPSLDTTIRLSVYIIRLSYVYDKAQLAVNVQMTYLGHSITDFLPVEIVYIISSKFTYELLHSTWNIDVVDVLCIYHNCDPASIRHHLAFAKERSAKN